jgi:hypothetical protein
MKRSAEIVDRLALDKGIFESALLVPWVYVVLPSLSERVHGKL